MALDATPLRTRTIGSYALVPVWVFSALVFYAFSIGPVTRLESNYQPPDSVLSAIARIYSPLFTAADLTGLQGLLQRYIFLWIPDKSLTIPQRSFDVGPHLR